MKKAWLVVALFAVSAVVFTGSLVFAEEGMDGTDGGMGRGGKMMGMMPTNTMIATSDGGVLILSGPRLMKYDMDLNLVKEVELPRGKRPAQREPEEAGS